MRAPESLANFPDDTAEFLCATGRAREFLNEAWDGGSEMSLPLLFEWHFLRNLPGPSLANS